MDDFEFPDTSQHTTVIGRNGSGKTVMGAWLLSHAPFDQMPYIIVDFKGDDLLNSLQAEPTSIHDAPPTKPGLYILHLMPHQEDELEAFLWKVHQQENTGLFYDEAFVVAKSKAMETILMQGRSKKIPCYILTQRPSWISRYAFSEASHFVVFHLNDRRDQIKTKEFFRNYEEERVPPFHSQWYNVKQNRNFILQPVPSSDKIRERFVERITEMRESRNKRRFI